jgi:Pentapeptide repeats (8 copies)
MANEEQLAILKKGSQVWNDWWKMHPFTRPDLREANLQGAKLWGAFLTSADLQGADLSGADLSLANLLGANLTRANLSGADLSAAHLIDTILDHANLNGCKVFGISAWNVSLEGTQQHDLIVTRDSEPTVRVDNLEVAQFIYLMLNNNKVRSILETLTTKSVLILGRFSGPLKDTLDAIRNKLREMNYLPIMFDFERLTGQDYTETIRLLAGMSKFVIADLSGARSIQQELQAIIPDFELPVVPIIRQGEQPWSMFESHQRADHVLPIVQYRDSDELLANFEKVVVLRAEKKYDAIIVRKAKHQIGMLSVDDVLDGD